MTITMIYIDVTVALLQDGGLPGHCTHGDGGIIGNPPVCIVLEAIDEIVNAILQPLAQAIGIPGLTAMIDIVCMAQDETGTIYPYALPE